jgi:adenylate cyclase
MRFLGRERWSKNPTYCTFCFRVIESTKGGAEIEASFLFADVRGSTSIAEGITAAAFRGLLNRFYDTAAHVLVQHDAIVDKFVGDEVVALFVPALTGDAHAARAVEAAYALLRATGHDEASGPWIPIGAGVHTGVAFIGSVGEPPVSDLTALGDAVNTTARLASAAAAGEILITRPAAAASGLDRVGLEQRDLALKGKSESTAVFVAKLTAPASAQPVA